MVDKATPGDAATELLLRRKGRRDLLTFTKHTHPAYMVGWHHRKICDALERVERGECDRLMIFAPPRHGKSELVSLRFPAWYIGKNPSKQIICTSYNDELASGFGRQVRNIIDDEKYQRFFPGLKLSPDAKAANRWHTTDGGIYISAGVGGTLSGRGGHIVIVDDPMKNREEAESKRLRDRLWNIYDSDIQSRLMPGGALVIMHTRWHPDDLAGRLLEKELDGTGDKWEVICLPAIMHEGTNRERTLWPEAFPLEAMQRRRKSTEKRTWVSLYQQKPQADGGDYFERAWYPRHVIGSHPDVSVYITSDFAVTQGGGDFTEHAVWGIDCDDNLWALDWWSGQTTADVWIETLLDLVEKWQPLCWYGESGAIRRAIEPSLKKRMRERRVYVKATFMPSTSDKRIRARPFQGRSASGKVNFPDTLWADRAVDQLVAFPGKHDDAVDVCSLIANAIDKLTPGEKPKPKKKPKEDKWDRAFAKLAQPGNLWKVV